MFCVPPRTMACSIRTSCSGRLTGSVRSSTASTRLKIALFAPMPSASVSAAATRESRAPPRQPPCVAQILPEIAEQVSGRGARCHWRRRVRLSERRHERAPADCHRGTRQEPGAWPRPPASRRPPAPASGPRDAARAPRRSRSRGSARDAATTGAAGHVVLQSGMLVSRHAPHGLHERRPRPSLLSQDASAFRRELVDAAAALVGLLDPRALDPPALLEAIQQGIERIDVELELAARSASRSACSGRSRAAVAHRAARESAVLPIPV